jgi:hypothetical protein
MDWIMLNFVGACKSLIRKISFIYMGKKSLMESAGCGCVGLSFRQLHNEYAPFGAFLLSTHQLTHHHFYGLLSVWLVEHRLNFAAHLVDTGST